MPIRNIMIKHKFKGLLNIFDESKIDSMSNLYTEKMGIQN